MAKPRKRKYNKRNKGKIKIRKSVGLRKKSEQPKDTLKKAPVKNVLPTNGITFKVKIRKK